MTDQQGIQFISWKESFDGPAPSYSLAKAFHIPIDEVRNTAAVLLPEINGSGPLADSATRFATACRAYAEFQDMLEVTIPLVTEGQLHNRHYCYYESLIYLREIARCLLHGNLLASMALLRPFLELAVLHLYWRARDDEYALYYSWLSTGRGRPPFRNAVEDLCRLLPLVETVGAQRVQKLGDELRTLYTQACNYNHVASFHNSYVAISGGNIGATEEAVASAIVQAEITMRQVLYLYCIAHPMALVECPPERKFGFGGPVGLFASHELAALVDSALGSANAARLRAAAVGHREVVDRMQWYDSHDDCSAEDFEREWVAHIRQLPADNAPAGLRGRLAMVRAQYRGLMWTMNYLGIDTPDGSKDVSAVRDDFRKLMDW